MAVIYCSLNPGPNTPYLLLFLFNLFPSYLHLKSDCLCLASQDASFCTRPQSHHSSFSRGHLWPSSPPGLPLLPSPDHLRPHSEMQPGATPRSSKHPDSSLHLLVPRNLSVLTASTSSLSIHAAPHECDFHPRV